MEQPKILTDVTKLPSFASVSSLPDVTGAESPSTPQLTGFIVGEYRQSHCPICLEIYTSDNPAVLFSCHHAFHLQCVESWRQRSRLCPVCMKPCLRQHELMTERDVVGMRRGRPPGSTHQHQRNTLMAGADRDERGSEAHEDALLLEATELSSPTTTSARSHRKPRQSGRKVSAALPPTAPGSSGVLPTGASVIATTPHTGPSPSGCGRRLLSRCFALCSWCSDS